MFSSVRNSQPHSQKICCTLKENHSVFYFSSHKACKPPNHPLVASAPVSKESTFETQALLLSPLIEIQHNTLQHQPVCFTSPQVVYPEVTPQKQFSSPFSCILLHPFFFFLFFKGSANEGALSCMACCFQPIGRRKEKNAVPAAMNELDFSNLYTETHSFFNLCNVLSVNLINFAFISWVFKMKHLSPGYCVFWILLTRAVEWISLQPWISFCQKRVPVKREKLSAVYMR